MTIFVTGADGFIGSHVVEKLAALGRPVRALSLYNSFGKSGWLDHIVDDNKMVEVVHGDVRDPDSVECLMKGCDSVIHLAALISVPHSYTSPASYVETNTRGTLHVLQSARKQNIKKFVHISSSEVYGTAQRIPMSEEHRLHAQSPYAASKIGADQLAISFHRSFDVPVAVVRPFNTFGPRQSLRAVVPTIITQALRSKTIKIGAITPVRDLTYVSDTARGIINALDCEAAVGETINLGTGCDRSIAFVIEQVGKILGQKISVETEGKRLRPKDSEVEKLCCDASKAKKILGWDNTYTLEMGLKETINWFIKNGDMVKGTEYAV